MSTKTISKALIIIFVFSIYSAGCSGPVNSEGTINYTQQTETLTVGSTELTYALSIPDVADDSDGLPLILALHYGGTVTASYGRDFMNRLILPALSELGAIIVSPNCPSTSGWTSSTSRSAILALIEEIKSRYNINDSQVIVTGYSMGGIGTWYYAANYPDIFSAAIPIASMPESYMLNMIEDIPIYVIQGMMDEIFDYHEVEDAVAQLEERGVDVVLYSIGGLGHYTTELYVEPLKLSVNWIRSVINL